MVSRPREKRRNRLIIIDPPPRDFLRREDLPVNNDPQALAEYAKMVESIVEERREK